MKKKLFYIVPLIVIFATVAYGWVRFNEKAAPTQNLTPTIVLDDDFSKILNSDNDYKSLSKYIEKPLVVEGIIKQISFDDTYNIMLKTSGNIWVSCKFQKDQTALIKKMNEGDIVKTKGIYKGSLNYLILLNCVIEKNQSITFEDNNTN